MSAESAKVPHLGGLRSDTLVVHADRHLNPTSAVTPPIFQTSTFRAKSTEEFTDRAQELRGDQFYTRHGNPTFTHAEVIIAALEGAESAMMVASGMGAFAACLFTFAHHGNHIIAQQHHYAGTLKLLRELLPRFGVDTTFVDQRDAAAFEKAVRPTTTVILVETPSNPLLRITDLRAVADIGKAHNIITIADNTFATPLNQRPLVCGIDLVLHSGTKYLGGHADLFAGVVVGRAQLVNQVWNTYLTLGPVLGPFDCWLLLRGLRTLPIRIRQHNSNGLKIAEYLVRHPRVKAVHYPGLPSHPQHKLAHEQMLAFGGVLSFELRDGYRAADRFMNALQLISRAASLGGIESLIVHPAAMWARYMSDDEMKKAEIAPSLMRLSVGIENAEDLIGDIEQALEQAYKRY